MSGPAPNPSRRRRNAPTIQTTTLPAAGREGPIPNVPAAYDLRDAGFEWWCWAWQLPQATRWDDGTVYAVVRRAQLEDHLAALDLVDELDMSDLLAGAEPEAMRRVEWALSTLKRAATGGISVMKEMRELDKRLGLDPKALVELRWTISADADASVSAPRARPAQVRTLRAVDAG